MGNTMKVVFLDRDGVICKDRIGYLKKWSEFEWIPGSREAISRLTKAGFRIFIVTNQSCIGKGIITFQVLEEIHKKMLEEINSYGGQIEKIYVCPHRLEEKCDCKKPGSGLLLQAKKETGAELAGSYMVGDKLIDAEAGKRVGCRTIIAGTVAEIYSGGDSGVKPDHIVPDLSEAVNLILDLEK
jgi:histidinol-phosphate phosphatase family protein